MRADQAAASNFDGRSDHREGIDGHAIGELGRGVYRRVRRDTDGAEYRGRPQRRAIEMAGNRDEGVIRLVHAQHGNVARRVSGKAFAGQHGAGPGRGQRPRKFHILDESNVAGFGTFDRRDSRQAAIEIGACMRLRTGQRGDIRNAQTCRSPEKTELGQGSSPEPR